MPPIPLDAIDDERLAAFRSVPDPDLLAAHGLFAAEGRLVVRRLLASPTLQTRAVLVTPPALAAIADLLARHTDVPVYVVPQEVMNGLVGYNIHRGCLALGVRPAPLDWRDLAARARRLVAIERVGDPDNVGSIFRNAAAFGVDGVLLDRRCSDPLYRKAIRTSMAAALTMPYARVVPWPGALEDLRTDGWATIALTPSADAPLLQETAAAVADRRVVLVLGHEGDGLAPEALDACSHRARIPIDRSVDSLNVAAAAAVALYEICARDGVRTTPG